MGMTVPPVKRPAMTVPDAETLREKNQWLSTAMEPVAMIPNETPLNTLRQSMKC
jgi:hypothetical protein